jgi:hypothetical protein
MEESLGLFGPGLHFADDQVLGTLTKEECLLAEN